MAPEACEPPKRCKPSLVAATAWLAQALSDDGWVARASQMLKRLSKV